MNDPNAGPHRSTSSESEYRADDATALNGSSLLALAALSLIAGAAAGLAGAVFRLSLAHADRWREVSLTSTHGRTMSGFALVITVCATATAVAAWLVRRFSPYASGSGIPHVEAVLNEELPQAPYRLIPVKFFGGLLAIGSGLALGREGPSVQMGASLAHLIGTIFRRNGPDCRVLVAAGAGAGLATAFNAPIAGAVFVLEELVKRFDARITIATFGASAGAIAVSRLLLGQSPDFHVRPLPSPGFGVVPVYLALGIAAGLLGVAYNRAILGGLASADRVHGWPVEWRAAVIGAGIGLLAWCSPALVGGGDAITQRTLDGTGAVAMVSLVLVIRFGLGAISYAAHTPGGLFAPMLVLGAQSGLICGSAFTRWIPSMGSSPTAFAVVGMAAFFTAAVRAPLTGIILAIEMTASFNLLLPMLAACFGAMLLPTLLRDPPIYDSLRERTLREATLIRDRSPTVRD
jgi:chloride channel protein, CIC family